jgi:hypothetical protein
VRGFAGAVVHSGILICSVRSTSIALALVPGFLVFFLAGGWATEARMGEMGARTGETGAGTGGMRDATWGSLDFSNAGSTGRGLVISSGTIPEAAF